jgi:amino acid transporter
MSLGSTAGVVFGYFANLTASAGLLTWWGICVTYTRWYAGLKAQGIDRKTLPYYGTLNKGAFAAWYAIVLISIILVFQGFDLFLGAGEAGYVFDHATFITDYLPVWLFPVIYFGYKFIKKTRVVCAEEMDFVTGLDVTRPSRTTSPRRGTLSSASGAGSCRCRWWSGRGGVRVKWDFHQSYIL